MRLYFLRRTSGAMQYGVPMREDRRAFQRRMVGGVVGKRLCEG
jgi:hypothetical protein